MAAHGRSSPPGHGGGGRRARGGDGERLTAGEMLGEVGVAPARSSASSGRCGVAWPSGSLTASVSSPASSGANGEMITENS